MPGAGDIAPVYFEPARSYATARALFVLLLAGFLIDLAIGGGLVHLWAWLLALVLVVGIDVLLTHVARTLRSITVTADEVRVGEHALPRVSIAGVSAGAGADPTLPVLGQTVREGLPRGVPGLGLRLVGGGVMLVPTRRPDRFAAALDLAIDAEGDSAPSDLEGSEVRPAEPDDLAAVPDIDLRAESLFRVSGLELPDLPFPEEHLADAKAVFVVGRPAVGFVWVDEVDGAAHVVELAVLPGRMRAGLGSALLEAACEWALGAGYPAITLTTFSEVAWNGPFYARRGFVPIAADALTPELAATRDRERSAGLDSVSPRVAMRRELSSGPG